ncbi:MAG: hypothetical protein PWQ96_2493 [Clostridia bacterium]|jgi:hypothetical protein|nr:hypothetical protein [Clostridia bacterium]
MRITLEDNDTYIDVCVRDPDGVKIETIKNVRSQLLYDEHDNWVGIILENKDINNKKIDIPRYPEKNTTVSFSFCSLQVN